VTADKHPYVFLNYMGERRDVLTLAHELGHAVHQTLAAPLGTLLADTPLTLAETASIFGEGLVFDRLLAEAVPADRRALLAGKIEDGLNTVVRQIAFHRFETRFHAERAERRGVGRPDRRDLAGGDGREPRPGGQAEPGLRALLGLCQPLRARALLRLRLRLREPAGRGPDGGAPQDPEGFAPLYEDLLAAGGSRTYVEALKPFGLDPPRAPAGKAFWAAGCARLERLVDEFEALASLTIRHATSTRSSPMAS
jgi:oligoendopeptidase F